MYPVQGHVGFICSGEKHCLFLSNEGEVFVAGQGFMQLGTEGLSTSIPKTIPNIPQITAISCGLYSAIFTDIEGNLWGVGENTYGQLGLGDSVDNIKTPTKIPNLPQIIEVKCGVRHTLCISEDSNLWVFGSNAYSQLFIKRKNSKETKPKKTKYSNIIDVAAGNACSYIQNVEGEIFVCGYNFDGQLGLGTNLTTETPCIIKNQPPNIVAMSIASTTALLLDKFGVVYAAGSGFSNIFSEISGNLPKIISISCGRNCKCVDEEGNLWLFGKNYFKKNNPDEKCFIKVDQFSQVIHMSHGHGYFDIIKDENGFFSCGTNTSGQLGIGKISFSADITNLSDFPHIVGSKMKSKAKSARK